METNTSLTATFVNVTVPNKPGELGKACRAIGGANINIEAFQCTGSGALFLTSNPTGCVNALEKAGYRAQTTELFAVRLPNQPGQVARLGEELGKAGVNIESCFAVTGTRESGRIFCRVNDVTKARPVFERLATVQTTPRGPGGNY